MDNKAESSNDNFEIEKDWADLAPYVKIDAKLIEFDEIGVFNSFNAMASRRGRLRIRLGLIESAKEYLANANRRRDSLKIIVTK